MTEKYKLSRFLRGELDGGRSPASNEMNSRQSHAAHGFGERSDFFANMLFRKKIGVLSSVDSGRLFHSGYPPHLAEGQCAHKYKGAHV